MSIFAVVKYSDNKFASFHDCSSIEEYKKELREEIKQNAKGRNYEIVIRQSAKTVFYYNSVNKVKKEKNADK